jgi:GT2 family glycosyltransferase
MSVSQTEICIAICTRNRDLQLREAIKSLAALNPSDDFQWHILVVDNASEDDTQKVIRDAIAAYPQITIRSSFEPQVGFAYPRNRAVRETDSTWIAFLDDDQIADPDWLIELWKAVERNNAVCVGGVVKLRFAEPSFQPGPYCRQLLGETDPDAKERPYGPGFEPGTGNLLIRKEAISECGGFLEDHDGRGEDAIMFAKMRAFGHVAWFTPHAIIHHVIPARRNCPSAYLALAKESSNAGDFGWIRWGWRLPIVSVARLINLSVVQIPKLVWFRFFGTDAQRLDQSCRARFTFGRSIAELRYCLTMLFQRNGKVF